MFRRKRIDPIRIAVFGVTGAGKSTLIKTITGDETIVIGNGLRSRKWAAS
jgi:ATPase subunit of ABC transporter with duplicated ATPase domains